MSAGEHDANLTMTVQPQDLVAYLHATGWVEVRAIAGGAGVIWQHRAGGRARQLMLPLDATYDDYADRLQEALDRLAGIERRSRRDLVADIAALRADVRNSTAHEDAEVRGFVITLSRVEPAAIGRITIATSDEDPQRRISVELDEALYRLAGEAHFSHTPVACRGRLARAGSTYALHNPHVFRLER